MAGSGVPPAKGSRRYLEGLSREKYLADGRLRGRPLPAHSPFVDVDGRKVPWHPQTRKWWNNWRKSPQAMRMQTDADWDFLLDTATLHHRFWSDGDFKLAAEIRLRVGKFGATPEDRARLRVEVQSSPEGPSSKLVGAVMEDLANRRLRVTGQDPAVASLDDRRARIVQEHLDANG